MQKRILLGIDANLSPTTQYVLRTAGEFFEDMAPRVYLILLHVIPIPQVVTTHPGMYIGQIIATPVPSWQRRQAEEVLHKATYVLQQQGVELERIEEIVRVGATADEIARVAQERQIQLIVIGSHPDTFWQKLRRFFIGSTSRRLLQLAPCPVMIVIPPRPAQPTDLVKWYEDALQSYLNEHSAALLVFTPQQAAAQFAPVPGRDPGRKEIAAATLALEHLANNGRLCRHYVKNEVRYVND